MGRNVAGDPGMAGRRELGYWHDGHYGRPGGYPPRPLPHVSGEPPWPVARPPRPDPGYEFGRPRLPPGRHRNRRQYPGNDRPVPGFEFDGSAPANGRHRVARPGIYGSWTPAPAGLPGYTAGYGGEQDLDRPAKPDRSTKVAVSLAALIAAVSLTVVVSVHGGGAGARPRSGSGSMAGPLFPSPEIGRASCRERV